MNAPTFETQLVAMKKAILSSYGKKAAATLLPDDDHERTVHAECQAAGVSCTCRVCYWGRR